MGEPELVLVRVRCPEGHPLSLMAEAREDGPDGEVIVFVVDKQDATCHCGKVVGQ